jgi:hypothetical protein
MYTCDSDQGSVAMSPKVLEERCLDWVQSPSITEKLLSAVFRGRVAQNGMDLSKDEISRKRCVGSIFKM